MTSVQSLGLREPSALQYLVTESILPPDPAPSLYKWSVSQRREDDGYGLVEEEVLITDHCVVWSCNGVVQRVLNLAVEGESISHAFVSTFALGQPTEGKNFCKQEGLQNVWKRALVVILRTQIHIFLVSGDTYIVPLSFEVESAHPCPGGFVLQRKLESDEDLGNSLQFQQDLSTINETLTSVGGNSSRPSIVLPSSQKWIPQPKFSTSAGMPRTYSFTQIMSELGLVVHSTNRMGQPLDECKVLPRTERLLFVSRHGELDLGYGSEMPRLCLALTIDEKSSFTLWQVSSDVVSKGSERHRSSHNPKPRSSLRKSSNMYRRDQSVATQPTRRPGDLRESLGGIGDMQYSEGGLFPSTQEQTSFQSNDLASQLGPEFGDVGVQTRSARRISSMLARTDLGSAADRSTFNDLAVGAGGRQSLNRPGRRGESIGSFNDRHSFGFRRRSSFPTNTSVFSTGTSFLDMSARGLLEDMDPLKQSTRLEEENYNGAASHLPRDIGFFRLKSFPRSQLSADVESLCDIKVVTLQSPNLVHQDMQLPKELYMGIMDKSRQELILARILVKARSSRTRKIAVEFKVTEVRKLPGIKDVCKVADGAIQRLAVLTESRSKIISLQLEAPWSPPFRFELPPRIVIHDPFTSSYSFSPRKDKDTGLRRSIPGTGVSAQSLLESGTSGQLYVVDQDLRRHAIQLQLAPRDPLVLDILKMCDIVLSSREQESLLVAFWEVSQWLRDKGVSTPSDWLAIVVVLFSLAVPFLNTQHRHSTPSHRRKKSALLRSSSGSAIDLTNYDSMHNEDRDTNPHGGLRSPAWTWLHPKHPAPSATGGRSKSSSKILNSSAFHERSNDKKNTFIVDAIALAAEYLQSPFGEYAFGPEGYLPTSISKDREQRCNTIPSILVGLHLLHEESKLNVTASARSGKADSNLIMVMAQLGSWLQWKDWTASNGSYYQFEAVESDHCLYDLSVIDGLSMPSQPFTPPSIYAHLEQWINATPTEQFLTLARLSGRGGGPNDIGSHETAQLTPRTTALLTFLRCAQDQAGSENMIHALTKAGLTRSSVQSLPDGVAAVFNQVLSSKKYRTMQANKSGGPLESGGWASKDDTLLFLNRPHLTMNHEALRDYHSVCSSALEAETLQRWDASSEANRQAVTKLIFSKDRRFPEASKLVNQTRPPVVECTPEPEWTEVELLDAQKELAQYVTRRTLSVAAGRGMMHFSARVPLLTERVPIPAFSLQCIMKPINATESTQAMTFSADKAIFTEEKVCWAFFHNGASMGLMISEDAQGIDTSWILYNKPPELTNRHAGFLLALGLNGHLKTLAKWVAFKYLTPKHTMTSIGLLLGLSVSFLGTMDTLITRLLSVHVTRLLPPGAAELNLSPLTQTTGIIGIGLLYYNSQHRRMSEVMLSEIENNDAEEGAPSDTILRDEGYRLAAGFALGLINLSQGKHLHGLHDMGVLQRLLAIAVGTKNVNMVHVLDRATAGAVMAIAFIFLKTNDEAIARKVDVPDTLHQFDYVRPDIFLLRTLARHLIMWNSILPSSSFVQRSLPAPYRHRFDLKSTKHLSTEDMPFFNILAGICFAIGLRFAGSQRADARDLLILYLDQFLRLSRLPAHNYDARVTLNSVRNCLDTLALAVATVMAGSGDLVVLRRLRALHGRTDKDTPFGSHLAAHMALGALFLAGGTKTFGTSDIAVASLCIAFYPIFPNDVLDNRGHLQALRHLWVLAVEGRCLVARDGDAGGSVVGGITASIQLKDGTTQDIQVPGLLPELDTIKSVEVKGEGFWDACLDFSTSETKLRENIKAENSVNVILRRRAAYDQPPQDLFNAELQALTEAQGIPSVDPNSTAFYTHNSTSATGSATSRPANAFEWLFDLSAFGDFDHSERSLVLSAAPVGDWNAAELLQNGVVDSRLELEMGSVPPKHEAGVSSQKVQKDKLWQLRLLFDWLDRWEKEDEELDHLASATADENKWFSSSGGTWLRKELVERLRWRVWSMTLEDSHSSEGHKDDEWMW
ncbi:Anaphase-promoting complex subunit 1 [Rhinocladiella similis]